VQAMIQQTQILLTPKGSHFCFLWFPIREFFFYSWSFSL